MALHIGNRMPSPSGCGGKAYPEGRISQFSSGEVPHHPMRLTHSFQKVAASNVMLWGSKGSGGGKRDPARLDSARAWEGLSRGGWHHKCPGLQERLRGVCDHPPCDHMAPATK